MFNTVSIDLDFSENLQIPGKFEPQSLHWAHQQLTVHSGVLKNNGEKSYHAYLSNDKKHDQFFVDVATREMLSEAEIPTGEDVFIIMETDNCSSQYKSATHFHLVQELVDELNTKIIKVFSVPEHGKGEVDHVGGIAKTSVRLAIAAGEIIMSSQDAVEFLCEKFVNKISPRYFFKDLTEESIQQCREANKLKRYTTIDGCAVHS